MRLLGGGSDRPVSDPHLLSRYGSMANEVLADPMLAGGADPFELLVPGLPYLAAEAVYAVRHEMARSLDDVLSRRTRARMLDREATLVAAPAIARLIAPHLGWDDAETQRQLQAFVASCADEAAAGAVTEAEFIASVRGAS
jgi:glycerol-3-phosphate dehydrogenase